MQWIQASSPTEGDVSWDFSSCNRNLGYILELEQGWPFETPLEVLVESWLSSWDDMGCMEFSSSCYTEINIHIDLRLVSHGIAVVS